MESYNMAQWAIFFYIYCLFGWIWESCYVSIMTRKIVNRGFLHGPWIPLYGTGSIMALFLTLPIRDSIVKIYFAGLLGATALEYVTGWVMETIFKVKYWDYSNQKIQYKGYICLSSSLFWGLLAIGLVRYAHPPIERLVMQIPFIPSMIVAVILTVLFITDTIVSAKEALDFRKVLVTMERIREELEQAQKQLEERVVESREQFAAKVGESKKQFATRVGETREQLVGRIDEGREQITNRVEEGRVQLALGRMELDAQLEQRIKNLRSRRSVQLNVLHTWEEKLLRRHPSASFKGMETLFAEYKKWKETQESESKDE